MTTTTTEVTALIDLARAKGLKIVASPGEMLLSHNQAIQAIKAQIAGGSLGTLCWAIYGAAFGTYHEDEVVRHGDDVLSNIDPSWYFHKPGDGPLYDMTVYDLHTVTGILGAARRVTALSGVRVKERAFGSHMVTTDADDNTLVLLDFGDNLFVLAYGTTAGNPTR